MTSSLRQARTQCRNKIVLGITGGICSGKSTVCDLMHQLGARVINADKLGHGVYERGTDAFYQVWFRNRSIHGSRLSIHSEIASWAQMETLIAVL